MKKIDLGQTIMILANVGVIAGILLLAFELQQNSEQLQLQARELAVTRRNSLVDLIIENPDLVELLGRQNDTLTASERNRLTLLGIRQLLNMEETFAETPNTESALNALAWNLRDLYWREHLNYGLPFGWETYKRRANPAFADWFQKSVVDAGPP